jgi:hypothetical protein
MSKSKPDKDWEWLYNQLSRSHADAWNKCGKYRKAIKMVEELYDFLPRTPLPEDQLIENATIDLKNENEGLKKKIADLLEGCYEST